jgi:hypothetical protein
MNKNVTFFIILAHEDHDFNHGLHALFPIIELRVRKPTV